MRKHRQYTEEEQATALALLEANGGNVTHTAAELGIPPSTLRKWRDGLGINKAVAAKCGKKKEALDVLFENVSRLYLGHAVKKGVISATKGKDAVIAAATAIDKMRLLRDEATSIHKQQHDELPDQDLDHGIAAAQTRLFEPDPGEASANGAA